MNSPNETSTSRLATVDTLRGFALLGILLINVIAFKAPWGPPGFGYHGPLAGRLILGGLILLVESKFFTLFSLLFGIGFSIQLQSARDSGARFLPRFLRRLAGLLLFGIAHVALVWDGDILILYALVGCLLIPFRNVTSRALLRWAAGLIAVPILIYAAGLIWVVVTVASASTSANGSDGVSLTRAIEEARAAVLSGSRSGGGYLSSIPARLVAYRSVFPLLLSRIPTVLAMFLLGLSAGRSGVLRDVEANTGLLQKIAGWGLGLGLPVSVLVTVGYFLLPPFPAILSLLFNQALAGPLMALGYGASLTLLLRKPAWQSLLRPLALTGRMSLTNYLTQSLACASLFDGWGLGLAGRVSPLSAQGMALVIFATQVAFSTLWLSHFRYGPAEWVWRAITYGTRPDMSRS